MRKIWWVIVSVWSGLTTMALAQDPSMLSIAQQAKAELQSRGIKVDGDDCLAIKVTVLTAQRVGAGLLRKADDSGAAGCAYAGHYYSYDTLAFLTPDGTRTVDLMGSGSDGPWTVHWSDPKCCAPASLYVTASSLPSPLTGTLPSGPGTPDVPSSPPPAKGDKGDPGPRGPIGPKGDKGDKGEPGDAANVADLLRRIGDLERRLNGLGCTASATYFSLRCRVDVPQ